MSKKSNSSPLRDTDDLLMGLLEGVAKLLLFVGGLGFLGSFAFLCYYYFSLATSGNISPAQAAQNIEFFTKVLYPCAVATAVGVSYLYWGEEVLGALLLLGAGLLFFCPQWLPFIGGVSAGQGISKEATRCSQVIQMAGLLVAVVGIFVIIADVYSRVKLRAHQGAKGDNLKYGKGVQAEKIQNVFMGKCWQLPFCRKFVRERCPIYHAKRTCWKERVGCMCEEKVINDAMTNKPIPKEQLLSGAAIPRNNRLTPAQKAERCRDCVIYNEHQKHKYKVGLWTCVFGVLGFYALAHIALIGMVNKWMVKADKALNDASLAHSNAAAIADKGSDVGLIQELMLFCVMMIALAYLLKVLEFVIFRMKV